jgi:hypothetical protein
LRVSKAVGLPYERNARANAQRRNDSKAMSEPVLGRKKPPVKSEAFLYNTISERETMRR